MLGSNDNLTQVNEGCRIHGHLEVNKVAGNFHIAPGQSFQQHHVHVHSLRNLRLNVLNTTHYIHELTFGQGFPKQINPLSRTEQISRDGAVLYHYYVKIVPSTYVFLNGTQLLTNQYSVTKHRKVIRNLFDSSDHQLPGAFFTYEISAIMVKFVEQKRSLAQFLTSLCAIVVSTSLASIDQRKTTFSSCPGWHLHRLEPDRHVRLSRQLPSPSQTRARQSHLIIVLSFIAQYYIDRFVSLGLLQIDLNALTR